MSRSIQTVKGRETLKIRREPHWVHVRRGCHLGFRKMSTAGDGVWSARYRDPDTKVRLVQSLGSFGELVANERFDAAKQAAEHWFAHLGGGGRSKAVTVKAACAHYVKHLRDQGREAAAKDAEGRFRRWVDGDSIGRVEVQKLTDPKVTDWRRRLAKTKTLPQDKKNGEGGPRTDAALNRDMCAFRAALNFAMRERLVTTDAAWKVALLTVKGAGSRRNIYLEPNQRRSLVDAAAADLRTFVTGLSLLPLRPGALAKLTVADFDGRLNVLRVGSDKNGRARHIPLPKATAAFFATQAEGKLAGAPLLARSDGQAWNKDSWKGPFKAASAAAGLPPEATAYALRHSTITDLVVDGLDIMTVGKISDTSIAMIQAHYGHLNSDRATQALAKLAL